MRWRPRRYQCPKCRWDFAVRKKRCCPGCGTLLLAGSDNPTDAELTELKLSEPHPRRTKLYDLAVSQRHVMNFIRDDCLSFGWNTWNAAVVQLVAI